MLIYRLYYRQSSDHPASMAVALILGIQGGFGTTLLSLKILI